MKHHANLKKTRLIWALERNIGICRYRITGDFKLKQWYFSFLLSFFKVVIFSVDTLHTHENLYTALRLFSEKKHWTWWDRLFLLIKIHYPIYKLIEIKNQKYFITISSSHFQCLEVKNYFASKSRILGGNTGSGLSLTQVESPDSGPEFDQHHLCFHIFRGEIYHWNH